MTMPVDESETESYEAYLNDVVFPKLTGRPPAARRDAQNFLARVIIPRLTDGRTLAEELIAEEYAEFLDREVMPELTGRHRATLVVAMESIGEATPPDARNAMVARLEPPPDVHGRTELHRALIAMATLRANTDEYINLYPDEALRLSKAGDWICDNLGELLPWTCK